MSDVSAFWKSPWPNAWCGFLDMSRKLNFAALCGIVPTTISPRDAVTLQLLAANQRPAPAVRAQTDDTRVDIVGIDPRVPDNSSPFA